MTNTLRNRSYLPETDSDDSLNALIKRESSKDRVSTSSSAGIVHRSVAAYFHRSSPTCKVLLLAVIAPFSLLVLVYVLDMVFTYHGHPLASPVVPDKSFAVVINTFKRPEYLQKAVRHYADTCGRDYGVAQVFVIWSELDVEPPDPQSFFQDPNDDGDMVTGKNKVLKKATDDVTNPRQSSVSIIRVKDNSLNCRFLPIQDLQSNAIFMVDDDSRVSCKTLYRGFEAWTYHPYAMTGFYPRLSSFPLFETRTNTDTSSFIYHTWPVLYLHSSFNIILTKAGFLHKDYLDIYSDTTQHPPEIHQHVKKVKNCEDIAMSFLIANRTRSEALKELSEIRRQANVYSYCSHCPVYVEGDVSDMGLFKGISTQSKGGWHKISGHMGERNKCIDVLAQIYKNHGWEYPLFDLPLVDHSWTHHFPGFWWQQHPSNFFEWLSFGNTFK